MAPVEHLPAPRRAAQEQTVLRGPKATTADSKQADPVVPTDPPEATADSKQADPADPLAKTADSKQADPVDPLAKTADSEPTDPFGPTAWAEQPRLLVPESPLTDRDPPSQSLLSRSQAFKDQVLTVLRPVVRLRTSPGTLRALDPSTSAAKADFTPSTDPKAANAPAHRI